jgi:hypothetical protein
MIRRAILSSCSNPPELVNQPGTTKGSEEEGSSERDGRCKDGLRGMAWPFHAIFVLENLFLIGPAALYF